MLHGEKMTRVLITADLHLSANARDSYRFKFMDRLPKLIQKHDVKFLIVAGDLTEMKDYHGSELVNRIADYFKTYSVLCQVIVTRGNHDGTDPNYPFYQFLKHVPNVTWVNKPNEFTIGKNKMMFLPH